MRPYAADDSARHGFVELVRSADVAFTQLDILLNDFRGPPAPGIGIHISTSPRSGQNLLSIGFNLFSTAGNHVLDFGVEGLRRHLEALRELGMSFAGVGETAADAAEPAVLELARGRVALVAAAFSLGAGWPSADPSPGIEGRPGVNALRFHTRYLVDPETFAQVRRVARVLGAEERERYELQMGYVPALANAETELRLLDGVVERASERRIATEPRQEDLVRITAAIREARAKADVVIVGLHTHEYADNDEQPAQFARTFAHACVDAGAHMVAMSGAHVLRGIELYRGSPVFYGLGNVWFEYELLERLPRDSLEYYGLPADATPGQFADNAMLGFQRDARFWETVLPLCSFAGGELRDLTLHPVTLGFGRPRGRRGQPELAAPDDARRILSRLDTLSRPFGTHIDQIDHGARVRLDQQRDGIRRKP
jgi:poly-gamma-glutamate capsule biosynthesis protein CapA/YwtB (metallophosphatase superfamily)